MKSINIEPFLTPIRIRNLLLTIETGNGILEDVKKLLSPGIPYSPTVDQLIVATVNLGLIQIDKDRIILKIEENIIKNEDSFKRMLARKMITDPKYLEVLQNVLMNQELLYASSIDTINDNFKNIFNVTGNYFKGFRFWFEYFGYGFVMSSGMIVAPVKRIELEIDHFLTHKKANLLDFLNQLCIELPEFADMIENNQVDEVLSLVLIHFEELGVIKLSFQSDAYRFVTLKHNGMSSNYSDIEKV